MRFILITITLLLLSLESRSCSCVWLEKDYGSFLDLTVEADAVVLVKIKRHTNWIVKRWSIRPGATRVKVLEDYMDNVKKRRIKIWGDPGWLCLVDAREFKRGQTYLVHLFREDTTGFGDLGIRFRKYEKHGSYLAGTCGERVLEVRNDSVFGIIEDGTIVPMDSDLNWNGNYVYWPLRDDNHNLKTEGENLTLQEFNIMLNARLEENDE